MIYHLKNLYYKIFKGYPYWALWQYDQYVVETLRKSLRAFVLNKKKNGMGCPAAFFENDSDGGNCKKWDEILDKILWSFENFGKELDGYEVKQISANTHAINEHKDKQIEGFELFGKYFLNLWD